jgi:DNA-binding LacI/PurR family transcriptional regulator
MPVTIKDIARQAGVSHPTVSRALRDHPDIAPETANRIKQIAFDMGYMPSAVARGLKTNRSEALGVIVTRIDDPFFSEVLEGIENALHPAGYSLFVAASQRDSKREQSIVQAMGERRVDGVIICSTAFSAEHSQQIQRYGVPCVVVNNQSAEEYKYSIYHDDRYGSRQLTRHLLDLGHKKVAFLGNVHAGKTTQDRLDGFRDEMEAAGLPILEGFVHFGPNGHPEGGYAGAQHFLQLPEPPTAVVCFNDMMALGLMHGFYEAGLQVPADCSVTGFDNIGISAFITPGLTTFDQPKYHLGFEAASMMLRLLNQQPVSEDMAAPQIIVLRGELLLRASTAPPNR